MGRCCLAFILAFNILHVHVILATSNDDTQCLGSNSIYNETFVQNVIIKHIQSVASELATTGLDIAGSYRVIARMYGSLGDDDTTFRCLVSRSDVDKKYIIAFGGNPTSQQMISISSSVGAPLEYYHQDASVFPPWLRLWESFRSRGTFGVIFDISMESTTTDYEIVFTGSKIGASQAMMAAFEWSWSLRQFYGHKSNLVTIDAPRVGNYGFAQNLIDYYPNAIRVTYGCDEMTQFPPCYLSSSGSCLQSQLTYYHAGIQINYQNNTSEYKMCTGIPCWEDVMCKNDTPS